MSSVDNKLVNVGFAKELYNDLRGRIDNAGNSCQEQIDELEENSKVAKAINTPSDIQSFSDAARFPMELKVGIDPVQDLHGYDHPWVGGTGKNLLPKGSTSTVSGITFTVNDDGTVLVTGTSTSSASVFWGTAVTLPAGNYILNGCPSGGGNDSYRIDIRKNIGGNMISPNIDTGNGANITISESASVYVNIRVGANYAFPSAGSLFKPMLRLSTETDPTFAPYSNICPITGWTGANVTVTGENFCPLPQEETKSGLTLTHNADGSCTVTGENASGSAVYFDCISDFDSTKFAGYLLSAGYEGTNETARIRFTQQDYTSILNIGSSERAITDNGKHTKISVRVAANYALPAEGITFYPLLRAPDGDGTFEPYKGETHFISFPTSSGNVYGGELTVHSDGSGELVVDKAFYELDGSSDEEWYVEGTGTYKFARTVIEPYRERTDPSICNEFTYSIVGNNTSNIGYDFVNENHFRVRYGLYTSLEVSDVRTYLSNNPIQILYYLASPITYTITPRQVFALLDTNNVWADCGQINYLEYVRDTVGEVIPNRFDGIEQDIVETNTYEKTISEANAIQTFDDGANWPMGMQIAVDPVQDLHGYSNPWPGGGGKNLLPITVDGIKGTNTAGTWSGNSYTLNGIKFDINTDGSNNVIGIAVSGTATDTGRFYVVDSADITLPGSCIFSLHASVNPINMDCTIKDGDNRLGYINATSFVNGEQLLTGTHITQFIFYFNANMSQSLTMYPMIRLSTVSDSTFEPYSNICPITGWTGANVCVFGSKNIATTQLTIGGYFNEDGTIHSSSNYRYSTELTVVKQNTNYVCSMEKLSTAIRQFFVVTYDNRKNFVRTISVFTSDLKGRVQGTFQTSANEYYIRFAVPKDGAANNIQIELGTVASAFENYAGATYPITFPNSAGTVYGGTLTVNKDGTGELVVDKARLKVSECDWVDYDLQYGRIVSKPLTGYKTPSNSFTQPFECDSYDVYSGGGGIGNVSDFQTYIGYASSNYRWCIHDSRVNTKADFIALMGDCTAILPLATPITYTLSVPQVLSLISKNHVWADTGNILSLTYNSKQGIEFIREATSSQSLTFTLPYSSWSNDTPSIQTINANGVTETNNIIVGIGSSATSNQIDSASAGKIMCTAQGIGTLTFTCYGSVPSEDIPITVIIVR